VTVFNRTRANFAGVVCGILLLSSAAFAETAQQQAQSTPGQSTPAVKADAVVAAPAIPKRSATRPTVRPVKVSMPVAARTETASLCLPFICPRYLVLGVAY